MRKIKHIIFFFTMILSIILFEESTFAATNAVSKQEDIEVIQNYIGESVDILNNKFSELSSESNVDLKDIEELIESHYKENPAPQEMLEDNSIDIQSVFPQLTQAYNEEYLKSGKDLNKFITRQKTTNELGQVYTYKTDELNYVEVFLSEMGDISILEFKTVDKEKENEIQLLSTQKYTSIQRTTGVSYSSVGTKLFTLWAEASFKYNGSSVASENIDGDWGRHFWGSTMNITAPAQLVKTRTVSLEGYKYAEVYTRLAVEAGFGFRWASLVLTSATVEAYVGSTVNGNVYGGLQVI